MKIVEISVKKDMLKIDKDGTSSWYKINPSNTPAQEVVNTLVVGDEVDVKSTVINGVSVVSRIDKSDSPATPVAEEETMEEPKVEAEKVDVIGAVNNFEKVAEETAKYKCTKCGKVMKDDKYENCYTCNQAEWKSKQGATGSDRNNSIERQAIGKMTARTVSALIGTWGSPPDTAEVEVLIDFIYNKYKQKVTE